MGIGHVVCLRAYEDMARVDAQFVVAGMAKNLPFWDRAVGKVPSKPVGARVAVSLPASPIAVAVNCPGPDPATVWPVLVHLGPEQFIKSY
jgi:hypothetical protein